MKSKNIYLSLILLNIIFSCVAQQPDIEKSFEHAQKQTKVMLKEIEKAQAGNPGLVSPRTLTSSADLHLVPSKDWTSGFFPGVLWYLYEYNKDNFWLKKARDFTTNIEKEKKNAGTHDMGFKIYCSFGNGYRLTMDEDYKQVIIESAKTLISRFNPAVGAIRSWDHNTDKWDFPVIIDNMMNLELLFAATRLTGDSSYYKVAISHANTTLENHFREDFSSYHVIDYNPKTGAVENKHTHQGLSHASAWARGQAWGLYGYTMAYRETKDEKYLELAEEIANYVLNHPKMPDDLVPYWDFDDPKIPNAPRDASAAAVMASALYELSTYSDNGKAYFNAADKMLKSLSEKYISPVGENKGFILLHSTGHHPKDNEIDVPLIYADYYYLEALLRKKN